MENASKALIIAGAILLVIAIIAIAVGIVGKTRGSIDTAGNQIDTMGIEMHNSQFRVYESNGSAYDKTFEEVRECVRMMMSVNESNKNNRNNIMYLTVSIKLTSGGSSAIFCIDDKLNNASEQKVKNANVWGGDSFTIQSLYNASGEYDRVINRNKYNNSSMYNISMITDERGYINHINIWKEGPLRVSEGIH